MKQSETSYYRVLHQVAGHPQRTVLRIACDGDDGNMSIEQFEYSSNAWVPAGALWVKAKIGGSYDYEEIDEVLAKGIVEGAGGEFE